MIHSGYVYKSENEVFDLGHNDSIGRLVVGIALFNNKSVLLLKRKADDSYPNNYELPGGLVESDESLLDAAIRELFEETSIRVLPDDLSMIVHGFDYETASGKTRQINFIFSSVNQMNTIRLTEHSSHTWAGLMDIQNNVFQMTSEMRDSLLAIFNYAK